jgi:hypothetical protein
MDNIYIDSVESDPKTRAINKRVWDGQEFRPVTYYRVPMIRHDLVSAQRWLQDQFGDSSQRETWWVSAGSLFMTQQIYTWWCLAHGVPK